jgi:DNA-binding response OmpR family regulator
MTGKKRILIIEDNPMFGSVLRFVFRYQFEITQAVDGEDGWKRLQDDDFDIIMTDCQMPLLDGISLSRRIRAEARLQHIPIMLVTAKAFELEMLEIQEELQPCAVFLKPFDAKLLLATANRFLSSAGSPTSSYSSRVKITSAGSPEHIFDNITA